MKVIDLPPEHEQVFFQCLEDWSDEIKEAGTGRRKSWYEKMRPRGLRVKLALDDNGVVGGMIQYLPIEHSTAEGTGLYFIPCIWVHGYKQGRGNFQKRGMGKALLAEAEEEARALGAKGMAAWGISLPFWMKASWYKKQGYKKADGMGIRALLWKPFAPDAVPPRFLRVRKRPEPVPGKVAVTAFTNGWCQAMNLSVERAKRAAATFGERVVYREIDTSERAALLEWGISDALFIDDKEVSTGPPPAYEKLRKLMEKRVRKLG